MIQSGSYFAVLSCVERKDLSSKIRMMPSVIIEMIRPILNPGGVNERWTSCFPFGSGMALNEKFAGKMEIKLSLTLADQPG